VAVFLNRFTENRLTIFKQYWRFHHVKGASPSLPALKYTTAITAPVAQHFVLYKNLYSYTHKVCGGSQWMELTLLLLLIYYY